MYNITIKRDTNKEGRKMTKRTLEEIIAREKEIRSEGGTFGIEACKESIKSSVELFHKSLYELLGEYYERANTDAFFNKAMVLACWELINEQ